MPTEAWLYLLMHVVNIALFRSPVVMVIDNVESKLLLWCLPKL